MKESHSFGKYGIDEYRSITSLPDGTIQLEILIGDYLDDAMRQAAKVVLLTGHTVVFQFGQSDQPMMMTHEDAGNLLTRKAVFEEISLCEQEFKDARKRLQIKKRFARKVYGKKGRRKAS